MVEAARIAYRDFPTVVNEVPESGISYDNTMEEYARMDSQMQNAQKAIGGSSDSAQLSQSYYWTKIANGEYDETTEQLYENTVVLAVCAQLAIDGCKKVYSVDVNDDIQRIRSQPCMSHDKDYPAFMKYTHDIALTKNGKDRPREDIEKDKRKLKKRINPNIICPMNWVQERLDKIQGSSRSGIIDTKEYFIYMPGEANNKQMTKIRKLVEEYDGYTKRMVAYLNDDIDSRDMFEFLIMKTDEIMNEINKIKISKLTMNRLLSSVLGIDMGVKNNFKYKEASKYVRKMMNIMYRSDTLKFLENFKKG